MPHGENQYWILNFISDACSDGRRFRVLAVVDDHSRKKLAQIANTSLSCLWVTRALGRDVSERGRRGRSCLAMAPSSPVWSSCSGLRTLVQGDATGIASRRECRPRTHLSKASKKTARRMPQWNPLQLAVREVLKARQDYKNIHRARSALGSLVPREFAEKMNIKKLAV